jgi:hypothetical protein
MESFNSIKAYKHLMTVGANERGRRGIVTGVGFIEGFSRNLIESICVGAEVTCCSKSKGNAIMDRNAGSQEPEQPKLNPSDPILPGLHLPLDELEDDLDRPPADGEKVEGLKVKRLLFIVKRMGMR